MSDMAPTTQSGHPEGLRARKRAATRAAIEKVAFDLVQHQGYESVTVDMICEASMVSQRTFFNYFGSKEGVILGAMPQVMSDADAEDFVAAGTTDVVKDLITRMVTALIDPVADRAAFEARERIIHGSPELMAKQMEWMAAQEKRLIELVLARFHAAGRTETETPDLAEEASMVVSLAISVLRFTLMHQFSDKPAASTDVTLRHALELIERVMGPGRRA